MDIRKAGLAVLVAQAAFVATAAHGQGRIIYQERAYDRPAPYAASAACTDRYDALDGRRSRLEEAMAQAQDERVDIDRAADELANQLRFLDSRDSMAVDAYNQRSAEHNRRVAAHNDRIARLNRGGARLNDEASLLNADCAGYRTWHWNDVEALPAYRLR